MDEKEYLHSLAKDNDDMIEELKDELPNFFSRIFVDSDQEFNIYPISIAYWPEIAQSTKFAQTPLLEARKVQTSGIC